MRDRFTMGLFHSFSFLICFTLSGFLACANSSSGGNWQDNILCRMAGFKSCDQLDMFYTFEASEAQGRGDVASSMDVSNGAENLVFKYAGQDLVNLLETTVNFTVKQSDLSLPEVKVVNTVVDTQLKTITLDLEPPLFDGEGPEILQLNNRKGYEWQPSEIEIANLAPSECKRNGFEGGGNGKDRESPCLIETLEQLQKINDNLDRHYRLINSIDFLSTTTFTPIGTATAPFTGSLDGNGHTLQNLQINMSSENNVGFVRACSGCRIDRLSIIDVAIEGNQNVGGFVGNTSNEGLILNQSYLIGTIQGMKNVGGVVGSLQEGTVQDSYTVGEVITSGETAGGLIGLYNGGTIRNSYSIADVSGPSPMSQELGGIVGVSIPSGLDIDISSVYWLSESRVFAIGSDDLDSDNMKDANETFSTPPGDFGFANVLLRCPVEPNTKVANCGSKDDSRSLYTAWNPEHTANPEKPRIWSFGDNNSYPVLRLVGNRFPGSDEPVRSADANEILQSRYIVSFAIRSFAIQPNFTIGDNLDSVTTDFQVEVRPINGFSITWRSSDVAILAVAGEDVTVTRPVANTDVTLTATLTKGTDTFTRDFTLTVKQSPFTFALADSLDSVTTDFQVEVRPLNGFSITWRSSNDTILAVAGEDVTVTRPMADTDVMLTATLTKGTDTFTRSFTLTVNKQP